MSGSSVATEAQARQKLQAEGYTDITNFKSGKDGWTAQAKKGGKLMSIDIDHSGMIEAK